MIKKVLKVRKKLLRTRKFDNLKIKIFKLEILEYLPICQMNVTSKLLHHIKNL